LNNFELGCAMSEATMAKWPIGAPSSPAAGSAFLRLANEPNRIRSREWASILQAWASLGRRISDGAFPIQPSGAPRTVPPPRSLLPCSTRTPLSDGSFVTQFVSRSDAGEPPFQTFHDHTSLNVALCFRQVCAIESAFCCRTATRGAKTLHPIANFVCSLR
jgi:hypothetical protein